jgi:hypothetical protein
MQSGFGDKVYMQCRDQINVDAEKNKRYAAPEKDQIVADFSSGYAEFHRPSLGAWCSYLNRVPSVTSFWLTVVRLLVFFSSSQFFCPR